MDHQEHQDNHGFRCEDLCSKCAQELNCDDTGDLHHSSSHSSQGHHQSSSHSGCSRKTGSVCDSKPKGSHSSLSGHHRGCSGSRHRLSACPSDISIDENCPIHGKLSRSHHGEDSPSSAGSECKATACQQKPQVRFSDCDTTGPDGLAARERSPSESRSHSRHRTEPPARSRSGQPGRDVGKTPSGKDFPQKGQTSCEPQITLSVHRSKSHSSRRSSKPRATDSPACSARNFNESKMKFDLVFENICENLSDEMYRIQKDECITCCVPSYITKGKSKMGGRQSKCDVSLVVELVQQLVVELVQQMAELSQQLVVELVHVPLNLKTTDIICEINNQLHEAFNIRFPLPRMAITALPYVTPVIVPLNLKTTDIISEINNQLHEAFNIRFPLPRMAITGLPYVTPVICAQELNCDDTGDLHHSSSHSSQGHHQSSSHSGCSRKTGSVCDSKPKGSHSSLSGHHRGCSGSRHRLSACPSDISIDENCPIHGKLSRSHHGEDSPSSAGSECKATACQQKPQVHHQCAQELNCDDTGDLHHSHMIDETI
ncbi:uncharacterized protein LOC108252728 [Diaphorina citri]|uniref:Uncharacterized protein LOC108252728 n=1 Tax=Diaphorina citri TaxID=121845 RepID=A0A3Q0IYN3_DIACI|nr:uncharacterized protein LOC108252728 [Diaphorina citri]